MANMKNPNLVNPHHPIDEIWIAANRQNANTAWIDITAALRVFPDEFDRPVNRSLDVPRAAWAAFINVIQYCFKIVTRAACNVLSYAVMVPQRGDIRIGNEFTALSLCKTLAPRKKRSPRWRHRGPPRRTGRCRVMRPNRILLTLRARPINQRNRTVFV
jgi:hypothetical protein